MKLLGSLVLLCACGLLGLGAAQGLKARVAELAQFQTALEEMERELRCRMTPMPELLALLARRHEGAVGECFRLCAQGLASLGDRPFSRLWGQALEGAELSLTEEDVQVLAELGASLGRYDGPSQCAAIGQVLGRLEEQVRGAIERRDRLGRVYGALGLTAGAFLAIVLI